jgi:hypothetical protein
MAAPATVGIEKETKFGKQEDCELSGSTTIAVSCSRRAPLSREQ